MAKTTSTINGKTTKTGLIAFLSDSLKKVTDSNLKQRMEYTLKKAKKDLEGTAKSDLYDLAKEVMALLSAPEAPKLAVVENSTKPKLGKKSKKVEELIEQQEAEDAEAEEEEEETPASAPKSGKKKPVSKSKDKKKAEVEATEGGLTKKDLPMAKAFPKEIDHEALGHLVAVPEKYRTMDEIRKALEDGVTLVFAAYWTKRHLKEFSYGAFYEVPVPKAGFPFDLDTLQALYVCDGINRVYALSTYTEAMFRFDEEDLEPTECEANDGSKFMMRYSSGLEYEIYEVVE